MRVALVFAMVACGGSSGGADAPGTGGPCSLTLTGAQTGSQPCVVPRTTWMASSNQSLFSFNITSGSPAVQVSIGFAGQPTVGTHYTSSDGTSNGGVMVTGDSGKMWSNGSFDLSFTDAMATIVSATGTTYAANGTLTATMPAVAGTGASGSVMMTAQF